MNKLIKITQIRSSIGRLPKHKKTLLGLGLKGINHTVYRQNTNPIKGMIKKIAYMLKIEDHKNDTIKQSIPSKKIKKIKKKIG